MNAETSQKAFYTLEEACEELKRWGSIEYTPATLINNALQTMFAVNAMHPLLSLNLTNPRGAYVAGDLSLTPREIKGLWGFDTAPTPAGDDLYCFLRTLRDEGLALCEGNILLSCRDDPLDEEQIFSAYLTGRGTYIHLNDIVVLPKDLVEFKAGCTTLEYNNQGVLTHVICANKRLTVEQFYKLEGAPTAASPNKKAGRPKRSLDSPRGRAILNMYQSKYSINRIVRALADRGIPASKNTVIEYLKLAKET